MKLIKTRIFFTIAVAVTLIAAAPDQRDKMQPDPLYDIDPAEAAQNQHYNQPYRPQYHYSAIQGLVGDATGLIHDQGVCHLFYMSDKWERRKNRHKCWGHATSLDGLHWVEQDSILDPVVDNKPGSGSGIVDWNNTLGLASGPQKTLAVFYTDYARGSCIAYSTDAGRTWTRHPRNPVLPGPGGARDPLVFWYEPTGEWRMIRFDGKTGFVFYGSSNLLEWKQLSVVEGFNECPDFFELAVEGGSGEKKWVLMDANFAYLVGTYDGQRFTAETKMLRCEYGHASNVYASQSWKKTPQECSPLMQMAFLRYPKEPRLTWHSQMSFPVELHLRKQPEGIRLCRQPIQAIERLRVEQQHWNDLTVTPGRNPIAGLRGDLFDLRADVELAPSATLTLGVRGVPIRYSARTGMLQLGDSRVPLKLAGTRLRLQVLVDRSSIELFADQGQVSISKVVFFDPAQTDYSLTTDGGDFKLSSFQANRLKSIWGETVQGNTEAYIGPK